MTPTIRLGEILGYSPKQLQIGAQSAQKQNSILQQQISQAENNQQTWRQYRRNEVYSKEICDERIAKEEKNIQRLKAEQKKNRAKIQKFRDYADIIRANASGPEALQRKLKQLEIT